MKETEIKLGIIELEMKLSFQEHVIQDLNDALLAQQERMTHLETVVNVLSKKLDIVTPSIMAAESEETPPPHY